MTCLLKCFPVNSQTVVRRTWNFIHLVLSVYNHPLLTPRFAFVREWLDQRFGIDPEPACLPEAELVNGPRMLNMVRIQAPSLPGDIPHGCMKFCARRTNAYSFISSAFSGRQIFTPNASRQSGPLLRMLRFPCLATFTPIRCNNNRRCSRNVKRIRIASGSLISNRSGHT